MCLTQYCQSQCIYLSLKKVYFIFISVCMPVCMFLHMYLQVRMEVGRRCWTPGSCQLTDTKHIYAHPYHHECLDPFVLRLHTPYLPYLSYQRALRPFLPSAPVNALNGGAQVCPQPCSPVFWICPSMTHIVAPCVFSEAPPSCSPSAAPQELTFPDASYFVELWPNFLPYPSSLWYNNRWKQVSDSEARVAQVLVVWCWPRHRAWWASKPHLCNPVFMIQAPCSSSLKLPRQTAAGKQMLNTWASGGHLSCKCSQRAKVYSGSRFQRCQLAIAGREWQRRAACVVAARSREGTRTKDMPSDYFLQTFLEPPKIVPTASSESLWEILYIQAVTFHILTNTYYCSSFLIITTWRV